MHVQQFKSTAFWPVYILLAAMLIALSVAAYRANITITKIVDAEQILLPAQLKIRLLNDPDSELLYINYHGRTLDYFFISHNEIRVKIILNTLRKMITSINNSIPEGSYLLALHDAAPHSYDVPVLAFAAAQELVDNKQAILMPDPFALKGYSSLFLSLDVRAHKYRWQRKIAKIFFRGSATGAGIENNDINGFPRLRFMNYAANMPFVDAGFTNYTAQLNSEFQTKLAALHPLKPNVAASDAQAYKYLLDIDGNTCSFSRMAWILYSNSVLLKHTSNQVQWYYKHLKPYQHYIPINADFSNLAEQFVWAEQHPDQARIIAKNGHNMARQIFSRKNILRSTAQAFTEYNKRRL